MSATPIHPQVADQERVHEVRSEPRRLTRNTSSKMLGGVCSGLADYLDVDVTIVRLGVAAVALFTGVGALAYVAAWIIVPER
jgi:phage shock protein PspC (stress-responsive transcriptional regulator)